MLTKIACTKFREEEIYFHEGLNVVLGDDDATNSIGKTGLLLVIDFGFGGDSLLESESGFIDELGHHQYEFTFLFSGRYYRVIRGTETPSRTVFHDYSHGHSYELKVGEYRDLLKKFYGLGSYEASFREIISLYSRIWGKSNTGPYKVLHNTLRMADKKAVESLIKVFGYYGEISDLMQKYEKLDNEKKALRGGMNRNVIPKLTKKDYQRNNEVIQESHDGIEDIKENLRLYATNIREITDQEVLELKKEKDTYLDAISQVEARLQRTQMNIAHNSYVKSQSFQALQDYFPDIDEKRISEVEGFHKGVVKLMAGRLKAEEKELLDELSALREELERINGRISDRLSNLEEPGHIVDRVFELSNSLERAKRENYYYQRDGDLSEEVKSLGSDISEKKKEVLNDIEKRVNQRLYEINNFVYGADRSSPSIRLSDNGYSFSVFEDSGTGKAYASLIMFDLSVFSNTRLPVLIHDSPLFKNIENLAVSKLLEEYDKYKKQVFIAVDEQGKYEEEAQKIIEQRSVIKLSDSNLLYNKDWR